MAENSKLSSQHNSPFSDPITDTGLFESEISCEHAKTSSGFLDMLTAHTFSTTTTYPPSILEDLLLHTITPTLVPPATAFTEKSEVLNTPATPNSSSISSSSNEAVAGNDDQKSKETCCDDGEPDQEKRYKHGSKLKPKKKIKKREREPRFAFMTKSDIDHLDDGYRWRKYGQKAVKNSPFPRSYYRCTSTACGVKKRVERSSDDPSIVVTTYEGRHKHPCPITLCTTLGGNRSSRMDSPFDVGEILPFDFIFPLMTPESTIEHQPCFNNTIPTLSFSASSPAFPCQFIREKPFGPSYSSSSTSLALRDHGLLQDMLPSRVLQDPKEE